LRKAEEGVALLPLFTSSPKRVNEPSVQAEISACASSSRWRGYLRNDWIRCGLLVLVGFIIRVPALSGEMVWDDSLLIRDNPLIKSPIFVFEVFRHHLFLDSFSAHYRPVQNLSLMVDYLLWSGNTYGFHLTNVLLHVANGLSLYFLLQKLFASLRRRETNPDSSSVGSAAAFFVALLWIVHPVHSAAVDYISGRADSLAFLFACAGWLLFLHARATSSDVRRALFYVAAATSGLLSLCSREIAFIWFILFILHLLVFQTGVRRRELIVTVICVLCIVCAYVGLRQLPGPRVGSAPSNEWSAAMRGVLMLRALGDYGRLMIFPGKLHMERTVFDPAGFFNERERWNSIELEYLSIAGLAVLITLGSLALRRGNGQGLRIFGAAWFLLAYVPISNLVDLNATVAEHWLYLPSVGFLIFLAGCALGLPSRFRKALVGCACFAIVGLSVRSAVRSSDWATDEIFYQRTLAAGGVSSRVLVNLAQIYSSKGQYEKAETILRRVLKMSPDYPIARNNLAETLARRGKKQSAEEILAATSKETEQTRKEYPRTWIPVLNLALYQHKGKNDAGAISIAEKARHDYPGVWEIIRFESELLRETQGPDPALRLVSGFVRENWWHRGAAVALGRLYAEKGESEKAYAILRHASWLDVYDAEALNTIAEMRLRQNRLSDACAAQQHAIARQPDQPRQYVLLSDILDKMGRRDEARAAIAQSERLKAIAQTQLTPN
jgi:Flp pilus assembly protein TadD